MLPDAKAAILARLQALGPQIPLQLDNNTPIETPEPPAPWMFLVFLGSAPVTATIASAGAHLHREFGSFQVNVFVPHGTGTTAIDAYVQQIKGLFRATNFSGVFCDQEEPRDELVDSPRPDTIPDGVWFGITVTVAFRHDWFG